MARLLRARFARATYDADSCVMASLGLDAPRVSAVGGTREVGLLTSHTKISPSKPPDRNRDGSCAPPPLFPAPLGPGKDANAVTEGR
jgi:hypothetical protein